MSAMMIEGIVEQGQIKLSPDVRLPEGTRVYIVVPGFEIEGASVRVSSPRLARAEQAADFEMEVVES